MQTSHCGLDIGYGTSPKTVYIQWLVETFSPTKLGLLQIRHHLPAYVAKINLAYVYLPKRPSPLRLQLKRTKVTVKDCKELW